MAPRSQDFGPTVAVNTPGPRRPFITVDEWMESRRAHDGAEGLWRVHDKLYDLTKFIDSHPGGRQWLELTKGTDITEAFECNHLSDKAEKTLKKFYVRDAKTPRQSLITFHENGLFRTVKRKIQQRKLLPETGPLLKTKLFTDALAVSVFATGLLGVTHSLWWAAFSGVLLNMLAVCAHNFFHMKDNWRMHYFNLILMSTRDWRISHVLSHHLFPNTKFDLEINMFEPFFQFLPQENKKFRYLGIVVSPFVMIAMSHFQYARRLAHVIKTKQPSLDDVAGFSLFFFMLVFGGKGIRETFLVWNFLILCGSLSFALVGLTAAHHHPDIYHEGDYLGNDKDFGVLQLAAVRNRAEVDGNFMKTMVLFGEHALHHFFPSVDHGRLPALVGVLEETCKEFKIEYKPMPYKNLIVGMFQQLIRNYFNLRPMILEKENTRSK